jgi:acyl dehydratase
MPTPEPTARRFAEIKLGDTAEFEVAITLKLIDQFAALSGDTNPLHMDNTYAAETSFGGRIAHGMLGASFFSRLIGMHLPGKYAVYLSQQLFFRQPIRPDAAVIVRGTVSQIIVAQQSLKITTQVIEKATGQCLIDGEALVKVLE